MTGSEAATPMSRVLLLTDAHDYQRAVEFGDATGSVKNTIPGDMPSSDLDEIESVIASHKSTGYQSEMNR